MSSSPVAEAYRFVAVADRGAVERAVRDYARGSAAEALLRSVLAVFDGDIDESIRLLTRQLRRPTADDEAAFLVDHLVPLIASRGQFAQAATLLKRPSIPEIMPAYLAAVAYIRATHGDARRSDEAAEAATEALLDRDDPLIRARTLVRLAITAYQLQRYERAVDLAASAARLFESIEAYRLACPAYALLYSIHHNTFADASLARFYAVRLTTTADRSAELTYALQGLVSQLSVAAESNDERRLGRIRARLLSLRLPTIFRETFGYAIAEILQEAWGGRFSAVRARVQMLRSGDRSPGGRALCDAFLALADLADWDVPEAIAHAASAVSSPAATSEPHDRRDARHARIIAAFVEIAAGRAAAGRRSLMVKDLLGAPESSLAAAVRGGVDRLADVPPLDRGYLRAMLAARTAASAAQPKSGLTAAEMALLPLLAQGKPVTEIARDLGRGYSTVKTHVERINRKLGARGRADAVNRARELGLL